MEHVPLVLYKLVHSHLPVNLLKGNGGLWWKFIVHAIQLTAVYAGCWISWLFTTAIFIVVSLEGSNYNWSTPDCTDNWIQLLYGMSLNCVPVLLKCSMVGST